MLKLPAARADGPRMPRLRWSVLAAGLLLAVPAPAALAQSDANPASGICVVRDVPNVERPRTKVGVNVADADSTATGRARCATVARVVRGLARERAERPMTVRGYACTPTVTGSKVAWECVYKGGRPRTTVTLDFAFRYADG